MKAKQLKLLLVGCVMGIVLASGYNAKIFDEAGNAERARAAFASAE